MFLTIMRVRRIWSLAACCRWGDINVLPQSCLARYVMGSCGHLQSLLAYVEAVEFTRQVLLGVLTLQSAAADAC